MNAEVRQDHQYLLDQRDARQVRAVELRGGQGGGDRPLQVAGQGAGEVQRQRQRGRARDGDDRHDGEARRRSSRTRLWPRRSWGGSPRPGDVAHLVAFCAPDRSRTSPARSSRSTAGSTFKQDAGCRMPDAGAGCRMMLDAGYRIPDASRSHRRVRSMELEFGRARAV